MAIAVDPLGAAVGWLTEGSAVALATVVATWGSSPCPAGSHLVVADDGRFAGSVAGGCIEAAVAEDALDALRDGKPRLCRHAVTNETAWDVGLACGGAVSVLVEPLALPDARRIATARADRHPLAVVRHIADGRRCVVDDRAAEGCLVLSDLQLAEVRAMLAHDHSGALAGNGELFVRAYAPSARLLIMGAVHISQALARMAALAGLAVTVIDPRRAYATADRFPDVALVREWPEQAFARLGPDGRTAVVTLTHDPKLDDPALAAALRSPAFYIGALGSRRTHEKRLERLRELGFAEAELARIHGPVGIPLGGRAPAEIAVSALAQIIQARYAGS